MDKEQAVRAAALAVQTAIADAVAAGYRIGWPGRPEDLDKIAISETGKVGEANRPAPGDEYEHLSKSALVELAMARGLDANGTKADLIAVLKAPPGPAPVV